MRSICFYFQVHQPFRLRTYRFFDIGMQHDYFDDFQNQYIAKRIANKCYLPMNQLLLDLIHEYGSAFKVSFSISGTALDQFEQYVPEVIESFRRLADTGCVEFMAETYSHSLSSLKSKDEFFKQVRQQNERLEQLIGYKPKTFRNTELIYSDGIGQMVYEMGFKTMLTEGAKQILGWKSPNYLYCNAQEPKLKLLLKNFRLSDDIAFRFSQTSWPEWPLTTEKYVDWLNSIPQEEEVVNLFMDYETFGEHQWPETGIFEFMKALPSRVFSHSNFSFNTPSEVSETCQPVSAIHVPFPISWADEERDLTAWLGNELQDDAFDALYNMEWKINQCDDNWELKRDWKYLQTSDHFYYMCTKWFSDGDVHKYFNPYGSPYDAFINYMNILSDFVMRVDNHLEWKTEKVEVKVEAKAEVEVKKVVAKKTAAAPKETKKKVVVAKKKK
ncbi:MAG: glycoside hydrolase family 57 protein [Bacteroidota bacterium]